MRGIHGLDLLKGPLWSMVSLRSTCRSAVLRRLESELMSAGCAAVEVLLI